MTTALTFLLQIVELLTLMFPQLSVYFICFGYFLQMYILLRIHHDGIYTKCKMLYVRNFGDFHDLASICP